MTKSLYEIHASKWKKIEDRGFTALPEMAKHFVRPMMMDHALQYSNACGTWFRDDDAFPSAESERRAQKWLDDQSDPKDTDQTFLIICPPEKSAKVQKILTLLGCDFVDV